jgi:hypothetical protein
MSMDKAFVDAVLEVIGSRYRMGPLAGDGFELLFRAGKTEFRPSRFIVGRGERGRDLELTVDIRIPRDAAERQVEQLVEALETKTMAPRKFVRFEDRSTEMTSEKGEESGSVRTLCYRKTPESVPEAASDIRALVETIDIPVIIGIHEPEHVIAREAPPLLERAKRDTQVLEDWQYTLDGGLLHSLTLVVNPNERTLRVVERNVFSKKQLGEVLKLAHVAKFVLRRLAGATEVVALKKDGVELPLAKGSGNEDFMQTAGRFAKKVMIPLEVR